ncbi:MAG: glycosyltransferase family 2 protein [Pelatocladus maniniholoensis HA4357-MV3]|jgi:glycosyltransferase involved in cell wall biosynthesis|uniref:Glycosyltransferase family 2 protein n=1 Tax=Pelatocladus maniniholoensis HA4357-MV3 TaxID=1117104 RepID=A0A9E3HAT5_9NOST|nr:glycosyltransferase family 2 protein [Pelatocladus maniniholoensis HA4357-MV3]BAZ68732.1 family 2 glycosyl transferase [Fischerella sp. NIES-4106]
MIKAKEHSQLILNQSKLNSRHSELLANQTDLNTEYIQTQLILKYHHIHPEKTFYKSTQLEPQPVKIKESNLTIDEKRLLYISRLKAANLCEKMGSSPWNLKSNSAYDRCNKPCISVIITLYNYSEYIYECLESVAKTDLANIPGGIEVLVINDSSTDNSANLVAEYLQQSQIPICLVSKWFNTGLADARNVGLRLSRSPYVFILDADNWIYPNCLPVLYETIKSSRCAAVYGEIQRFDNQTRQEINRISCYDWDVHKLVKQPYIDAMALFNKNILLKLGGYSTELIEYGWFGWDDYDLWLKIAQSNYSCKLVPTVLSYYRVHSESMIHTTNKYALNIAKYFCHKFRKLANKYYSSDMWFGFPKSEIYLELNLSSQPNQNNLILQELQYAYAQIAAMESSKFWKLRNQWLKVKKMLGLAKNIEIN